MKRTLSLVRVLLVLLVNSSTEASYLISLAGVVSGVAIQLEVVSVGYLAGVVQNDNLDGQVSGAHGVTGDVSKTQFLYRDIFNVKADVVSGHGFQQGFMVHFDGLDFSR